jgi:outer membrane protein
MKDKMLWICTWLVLLIIMSYMLVSHFNLPKTAHFSMPEVFQGFELKKDLEAKFMFTKNRRQKQLDSLATQLKLLGTRLDAKHPITKEDELLYNTQRENFYKQRQIFTEDDASLTNQYDQEIITQLTQYVKDYGEANNYKYIFASENNQSLIYADESQNITKEILKYINNKYKGKK